MAEQLSEFFRILRSTEATQSPGCQESTIQEAEQERQAQLKDGVVAMGMSGVMCGVVRLDLGCLRRVRQGLVRTSGSGCFLFV